MKTAEKAGKATETKNGVNNKSVNAADAKGTAATSTKPEAAKPEAPKTEAKSLGAVVVPSTAETAAPQPQAAKPEAEKFALNLESTLKLVEELHRRKRQRDRLIETIENLEAFEIEQVEEADETDGNYYQGCKLAIVDDNRNEFATKNPVIIQAVATFVRDMCTNRLTEIEAGIVIPV
ncbi:hypothetical protein GCM10011386_27060 [Parapedobacter defluvii]|uniref:Uncharacterized protein n=1 Tax=Parapedobacter defluvii TaxID=2045106 RepID=A0ABQ1M321_9SPHI|nr:hypothetical protein [Parapedobacter defluvii]GGC33533.1 hypothetical protein GCM10011386_27060 [Parapedobacter defluvii]